MAFHLDLNRLKRPPSTGIFPKQKSIMLNFWKNLLTKGPLIEIGTTSHKIRDDFIGLNLEYYDYVNIIADAHYLPFKDNSIAGIHIDAVLEHVKDPFSISKEIYRVLKKEGGLVAWAPFIASYHKSPEDYYRFTLSGIRKVFSDFKEYKVIAGPGGFSALSEILRNCFAIMCSFKNELLFKLFCIFWGWIFQPIKYLDIIFSYSRDLSLPSHSTAAGFLYMGRK
ncbi:MAG: methyltransferase domain-containing protein [bacterium]